MSEAQFVLNENRSRACARSKKKQEFYQIALAELDVRTAIGVADDFIELMKDWPPKRPLPYHLSEAFVAHIAVSYSRPFVESRRSFIRPLPRHWSRFKNAELKRIHDLMISVRHTLFAHTDPTLVKVRIVPPGVKMPTLGIPTLTSWTVNRQTLPPHAIGELRATCVHVHARLEWRIHELMEELYGGMELPQKMFPIRFDEGL